MPQLLLPVDLQGRAIDDQVYVNVNAAVTGLYNLIPLGYLQTLCANRTVIVAIVMDQWSNPASTPLLGFGSGSAANDWRAPFTVTAAGPGLATILVMGDGVPVYPSTTLSFNLNVAGASLGTFRAVAYACVY